MKFEFDEDYFKDEIRSGFTITECMKRYWAASLKTLEIFDEICKRHDLTYWADCGTLLGAFRHHGFIPWDDDLDLGMPRKDYNRFLEIAEDELPNGFFISTYDSRIHRYNGMTVVINHIGTLFSPEVLGDYYCCPFPVGFDLYPYDNYPDDEDLRKEWRLDYVRKIYEIRKQRDEMPSDGKAGYGFLKELGVEAEKTAGKYMNDETDECGRFIFFALNKVKNTVKRKCFKVTADMPFETASIPVPIFMEELLLAEFGPDYVKSIRSSGAHDYPLYRRDIREMIDFLKKGGISLNDMPPMLQYIRREADHLGIDY